MSGRRKPAIGELDRQGVALSAEGVRKVYGDGTEALRLSRELALKEGILTGITGGATFAGALAVAREAREGANILFMLPDTGERYLSTPLFEHVGVDMTPEEIEISRSTPSCRFDQPPAPSTAKPAAAAVAESVTPDADAQAYLVDAIGAADQPVVMFALEWCEFCWSVRKLFGKLGVRFRSVDLDSVEYQAGDRGGKIRAVLADRIGRSTIPQVFVGGKHVGGCTELFDAMRDGSLQQLLQEAGAAYDASVDIDPSCM